MRTYVAPQRGGNPHPSLILRPTTINFMLSSPMLTAIVEQPLRDVFPDSMRTIEPHCVGVPDLNSTSAAHAIYAQDIPRDFIETHLMDW
jgi:hypothetical protein